MSMKRDLLVGELRRLAHEMVQGSLSETTRTCGREGCKCQRGERHGPHIYLTFRTPEGRSSALYVRPTELAKVRKGMAAWQRFWRIATVLATRNRRRIAAKKRTRREA
jgi:hypothetical protein